MLYDLSNIVSGDDYYKNDTHVSSRASLKIVSYMISILENSSFEENIEKLKNNTHFERVKHLGDLFNHQNWSYNRDNLFYDNKYLEVDKLRLNNAVEK